LTADRTGFVPWPPLRIEIAKTATQHAAVITIAKGG
jgi:hypothetical protein